MHYYEPVNGHGLGKDPFNAIVAPRPIGWISSQDAKGHVNLAPYSFFNAFSYKPPFIGFALTTWKDSVFNSRETGEFISISSPWICKADELNRGACAHDDHEFTMAGLTKAPSRLVKGRGSRKARCRSNAR